MKDGREVIVRGDNGGLAEARDLLLKLGRQHVYTIDTDEQTGERIIVRHTVNDFLEYDALMAALDAAPQAEEARRGLAHADAQEKRIAELEASLAAASAPHREVARSLAFTAYSGLVLDNRTYDELRQPLESRIASALASARRDALAEAAAKVKDYALDIGTRAEKEDEPPFLLLLEIEAKLLRIVADIERPPASPPESAPEPRGREHDV